MYKVLYIIENMGWIYLIKNIINGKCYIGQTSSKNVRDRWYAHRSHPSGCLKKAFKKYGIENFEFSTICEIPENDGWREELDAREILEIRERNTLTPNGYNIEQGGNRNKIVQKETRKKIGDANRGEKSPHFGKYSYNHPRSEKIEKWSKDGILIYTYSSSRDAAKDVGVTPASISACIIGKTKTSAGFVWKKYLVIK